MSSPELRHLPRIDSSNWTCSLPVMLPSIYEAQQLTRHGQYGFTAWILQTLPIKMFGRYLNDWKLFTAKRSARLQGYIGQEKTMAM